MQTVEYNKNSFGKYASNIEILKPLSEVVSLYWVINQNIGHPLFKENTALFSLLRIFDNGDMRWN
jgi:hypothetical protein